MFAINTFETASTCASCLSASLCLQLSIRSTGHPRLRMQRGAQYAWYVLRCGRPVWLICWPAVTLARRAPFLWCTLTTPGRLLQASSPADGPALGSVNSSVWQIGGNASLVSVSLDSLQQSTTVSSLPTFFSEAPSHPGAKRRLLQGCSCVACSNTQRIPAQASYTLTFSSANVIDVNIQSTDVRRAGKLRMLLMHRSQHNLTLAGAGVRFLLST